MAMRPTMWLVRNGSPNSRCEATGTMTNAIAMNGYATDKGTVRSDQTHTIVDKKYASAADQSQLFVSHACTRLSRLAPTKAACLNSSCPDATPRTDVITRAYSVCFIDSCPFCTPSAEGSFSIAKWSMVGYPRLSSSPSRVDHAPLPSQAHRLIVRLCRLSDAPTLP